MTQLAQPGPLGDTDGIAALLDRARALQPLIREHAAQGERDRRVAEPVIDALAEAGAFRLGVPRRYGGYEGDMKAFLDLSAIVGEADGATSWVVTLINVCAWLTGLYRAQAQDEVWGADPGARVCGVLAPTSQTRRVEGGLRVTGKWFYNSGSWHADWAILGVPVVDEAGEMVDQGVALIPRGELTSEDTWFVAGMAGSGSIAVVADDVFVPDHRIMSLPAAIGGSYPSEHSDDEAVYRAAFVPVLVLVLAGPLLGLGRGALDYVISRAATKPISYTFMESQARSTGFQLQIAEAALMIDTAHLHAYRAAADIDTAAAAGDYPDPLARARVRADTGLVADKITRAIDILMSAHGTAGFASSSPLQRMWRDAAISARHAVVLPQVSYEVYGKALLGDDTPVTPLI